MMLPMKRSEVFKILSDIFSQSDIKSEMELNAIEMSESPTEPFVILNQNSDHVKVYTQNIKYMRDTYKTIVSHVASKIVLMEGLSS